MTTKRTRPTQMMFADDESDTQPTPVKPKMMKSEPVEDADVSPSSKHNILDLPSKGQFGYPSSVEYRDIFAKDEEVLSSATTDTYVRTLNGVIKNILNNPSFFESMSIHDRDFVLIWLWANNYVPKKDVDVSCKHCNHVEKETVNLTELDVTDPDEKLTGAIQFDLKKTGKPIKVRLNTVGDELAIETFIASHEEFKNKFEYLMLVRSIDVGMTIPLEKKIEWVGENVTARELAIIKQFHKKFTYGVKTTLEHTCSKCEGVTSFALPFSAAEILYPNADLGELEFDFV